LAKKKKKWTREECRRRYVEGEKISFRTLSQESGRTLSLLGRWSKADGWVEEREQYQNKLRTKTVAKTIEKTSDRLSEELAKRNEDHVKGYEVFRAIANQFNKALLTELQASGDKLKLLDDKSVSFQRYVTGYKMAVEGERVALGMEYLDINKAIAKLVRDGFEVVEPEDEN